MMYQFCCNFLQGKEFETKMKDKKPGDLSDELRTALGMPVGPVNNSLFFSTLIMLIFQNINFVIIFHAEL